MNGIGSQDLHHDSTKPKLVISAIAILFLSLGFSALLNWSALEKRYETSILSRCATVAQSLRRSLEASLHYGKLLQKFHGMERLLLETQERLAREFSPEFPTRDQTALSRGAAGIGVAIASADGSLLYHVGEDQLRHRVPVALQAGAAPQRSGREETGGWRYSKVDGYYFLTLPLRAGAQEHAFIVIGVREQRVCERMNMYFAGSLELLCIAFLCATVLLIVLLEFTMRAGADRQRAREKRFSLAILVVIIGAQLAVSLINLYGLARLHQETARTQAGLMAASMKDDIERLLHRGVPMDRLSEVNALAAEVASKVRLLSDVAVLDNSGRSLGVLLNRAMDGMEAVVAARSPLHRFIQSKLHPVFNLGLDIDDGEQVQGRVVIRAQANVLDVDLLNFALDSVTAIIIAVIISVELLILTLGILTTRSRTTFSPAGTDHEIMRAAAFLFLFGIDISISFLPLHMGKLYEPIFGLSKDFVMGMPISVEFFCVGAAILLSGAWVDRRGWHEPFLSGLLLAALGALYSWLAPTAVHFIVSRALAGTGYGLALMASQGFVIAHTDERNKAQGLARLFAGIYAGSICGGVTGAMLADRFGYNSVFLMGALILLGVVAYTLVFMRGAMRKPCRPRFYETTLITRQRNLFFAFLSNRIVLSLVFFSSLPASIAVVGFLNYFSPIYLASMGVSQAAIGRVLMIYGISLIYIGPVVSRYVDTSDNKKIWVFIGCSLGSMSFLSFYIMEGVLAAVFGVLILGLSSSVVLASQSAYMLNLKITQDLGAGKAIGIFRSSSRIGQALGPMIFSILIATGNLKDRVTFFGLIYLLTAFLFLLLTQRDQETQLMERA